MLQIIRSEYGYEMNAFQLDYLGGHESLGSVILNATVKIFENGLYIGSSLNRGHAYLKWNELIDIVYLNGDKETIIMRHTKGRVLLEKAEQDVCIEEFLALVCEIAPDVTIIKKEPCRNDICDFVIPEERLAAFDEQDKRIEMILIDADEEDEIDIMRTWMRYLESHLKFPFEAVISQPQDGGFLKMGDRLRVNGIKDYDDFYGVIVSITYKGGKYSFPLCDLEVDRDSENFASVDDYSMWFANR